MPESLAFKREARREGLWPRGDEFEVGVGDGVGIGGGIVTCRLRAMAQMGARRGRVGSVLLGSVAESEQRKLMQTALHSLALRG